jgi:glycosyltransferase involved in cell wall biosynthesis
MKVAHLTSVHPRHDTRIFLKMCRSLAQAGYAVTLVAADGLGGEVRDGVTIVDTGKPRGRLERMWGAAQRVLAAGRALDADIYHLHDPELLPAGLALKRAGKRVIFDAHEDLPKDILSKAYLPSLAQMPISLIAGAFENFACARLDHVVTATPAIREKFQAKSIAATDINNFPLAGELHSGDVSDAPKAPEVCYIGGLTAVRGIRELVRALPLCKSGARLNLGGTFAGAGLRDEVTALPGWSQVNELGYLGRDEVRETLSRSVAGLVTLHPTTAYLDSLPVKMFEYMSASLPVIASDFPLWRDVIDGAGCGVCVDPLDPAAIAAAIDHLLSNPDIALEMGRNGRRAAETRYNWANEEAKLLALYDRLASTA